jgi:hypothetical protein
LYFKRNGRVKQNTVLYYFENSIDPAAAEELTGSPFSKHFLEPDAMQAAAAEISVNTNIHLALERLPFGCTVLGWVHTCNLNAYRNTVS